MLHSDYEQCYLFWWCFFFLYPIGFQNLYIIFILQIYVAFVQIHITKHLCTTLCPHNPMVCIQLFKFIVDVCSIVAWGQSCVLNWCLLMTYFYSSQNIVILSGWIYNTYSVWTINLVNIFLVFVLLTEHDIS
jgi:hypothetical protein